MVDPVLCESLPQCHAAQYKTNRYHSEKNARPL
jgi:hypothetical protein